MITENQIGWLMLKEADLKEQRQRYGHLVDSWDQKFYLDIIAQLRREIRRLRIENNALIQSWPSR